MGEGRGEKEKKGGKEKYFLMSELISFLLLAVY